MNVPLLDGKPVAASRRLCTPILTFRHSYRDRNVSLRGCFSCSKVLTALLGQGGETQVSAESGESLDAFDEYPLMSRFNLQGYFSSVWDHTELSRILVTLVQACDKRDFRPVVECVLKCNKDRRQKFGGLVSTSSDGNSSFSVHTSRVDGDVGPSQKMELECYRTVLYLAKYQCTSAFHAFFPTILKPCKGYHFWCPIAPVPLFDRLLRDAIKRVQSRDGIYTPFHEVSDVALGFRCVFGKFEDFR